MHSYVFRARLQWGHHCKHFGIIRHLSFELSFHYCLLNKKTFYCFIFSCPRSVTRTGIWLHPTASPHVTAFVLGLFPSALTALCSCSHTGESSVGVMERQGNHRTACKVKGGRRAPHPTPSSTHRVREAAWDSVETNSSFLHLKHNPLASSFLLGDWKVSSHTFLIIRT